MEPLNSSAGGVPPQDNSIKTRWNSLRTSEKIAVVAGTVALVSLVALTVFSAVMFPPAAAIPAGAAILLTTQTAIMAPLLVVFGAASVTALVSGIFSFRGKEKTPAASSSRQFEKELASFSSDLRKIEPPYTYEKLSQFKQRYEALLKKYMATRYENMALFEKHTGVFTNNQKFADPIMGAVYTEQYLKGRESDIASRLYVTTNDFPREGYTLNTAWTPAEGTLIEGDVRKFIKGTFELVIKDNEGQSHRMAVDIDLSNVLKDSDDQGTFIKTWKDIYDFVSSDRKSIANPELREAAERFKAECYFKYSKLISGLSVEDGRSK